MSWLKRKNPAPSTPGGGVRTVPTLYPDSYRKALVQAGKPVTGDNIVALVEFITWNMKINAQGWFGSSGDHLARQRFEARFNDATYDPERLVCMPDDMIDFLWAWSPRVHQGLHQLADAVTGDVVERKLRGYGDVLPMEMYKDS